MSRSRRLKLRVFRVSVFLVMAVFFLVPLAAMIEFSTRGKSPSSPRTLASWQSIVSYPGLCCTASFAHPSAIVASLELAVITSVAMLALVVPTMIWVRLRVPGVSRIVEFICLLPLTIPAIVLVNGLAPVYKWVTFYLNAVSPGWGDTILILSFAYLILVLPYTYRTLDAGLAAIDVKTLSEAARTLGSGWFTVMVRVISPNISAALLNASLLSVSVVLGEYTIAQLFNFVNVQVAVAQLGRADAGVSIAVALASLVFVFVLLAILSFVGGPRSRQSNAAISDAIWGQKT
ncbi:MAG TPA: ABC transporter permease [Candidatus Dormibacteraeota bacterium]|nr:ABC transporter permease [Candidatus Dormibacteraeota bacterium]